MDLKNSLTVCLLSFFASTLVVLIARSLDSQAASRIEPQLIRIAEQLEAINAAGGGSLVSPGAVGVDSEPTDAVVVHYFFSNTRCTTCRKIESQTHDVLETQFADQLEKGNVVWKTLNYEDPRNAALMKQYEIIMPVVVLTQVQGGKVVGWKRLDQVWGVVNDASAFKEFIHIEVQSMLGQMDSEPVSLEASDPDLVSDVDSMGENTAETLLEIGWPVPADSNDSDGIPLPE